MDVVTSAVEKVKGFAISSQNLVNGLLNRPQNSYSHNPFIFDKVGASIGSDKLHVGALQLFPWHYFQIEILKRLQREAFSDLMKLRDRQDKVERVLSFYKTSKGSPFQEASTHVRGEVDFLGGILMMRDIDSQNLDALDRAGVTTGITSRFIFETSLGQNDSLVAELIASETGNGNLGDISGIPLSLTKLLYTANVSDWCSATAIPVGAQCRDFDITRNSFQQGKGLTYISSFEPPLLSQHNGSAIGVTVRKPNVVASLAQSVSGLRMPLGSDGFGHCFNTFGQVVCLLPRGIRLSLMGLHQVPKVLDHRLSLGALTIPSLMTVQKLEVGLRLQNSNYKHLRWAVTVSDNPQDDIGWGVSLSGIEGPRGWDQYQFESFADLSLGKRFNLKPRCCICGGWRCQNTRPYASM
ncbi:hypothetical protein Patl1_00569 [Pistacia atlantica]|uniref:Uncharacterized protein n=1 Tax=Pistacia atlantica TaxID=434234 RepID=A0ACC1CDW7_9ROSI|nr:hypothetical protein Patl1_00569 [Pistacia atlantica]